MKKIWIIFLTVLIFTSSAIFGNAYAENEDSSFEHAAGLMSALGIIGEEDNSQAGNTSFTRAQFAALIHTMLTGEKITYTSDKNKDAEDDGWLWLGEAEHGKTHNDGTMFYDVASSDAYAAAVEYVASIGAMNGDGNGYFHPNRNITAEECIYVFLRLLNGDFKIGEAFHAGYIDVANEFKLTSNLNTKSYPSEISKRDVYVMLYNALMANPYTIRYNKGKTEYAQEEDVMLVGVLYDVHKIEGIVERNRFSSLDLPMDGAKDALCIDGVYLKTLDESLHEYLGYNAVCFYKTSKNEISDDKSVIYAYEKNNTEIKIMADDIIDYKKPSFEYYENGRKRTLKITGLESVIYNGKAITKYDTELLKPKKGSVSFIDNNKDGKYEIIKIDSAEVIFVKAIDYANERIVDYYTGKIYDFKDTEYTVKNYEGVSGTIQIITEDSVVVLRQTVENQGDVYSRITVGDRAVVGKIEKVSTSNAGNKTITVEGVEYDVAYSCKEDFRAGMNGAFYLTDDGEVAGYKYKSETGAMYGYVMNTYSDDGLNDEYSIKLFNEQGDVHTYNRAEYVKFNGKSAKCGNVFSSLEKDGETIPQLIYYKLNDDLKISHIDTAAGNPDGFVLGRTNVSGKYRWLMQGITSNPVCFVDSNTRLFYVPQEDKTDEDSYQVFRNFENDKTYSCNEVYFPSKDSAVADIMIKYISGGGIRNEIDNLSTPVTIVDGVSYAIDEESGDYMYIISGYTNGGKVTYKCRRAKLFNLIKEVERGDLVRCQKNDAGWVTAFTKVYDISERKMTSKSNPDSSDGKNIMAQYMLFHGKAYNTAEENNILRVMPYDYSDPDNITVVNDEEKLWLYNANGFAVTICDTTMGRPVITNGTYNDIKTQEIFGDGDELLIYTFYSDQKSIFVIR